MRELKFRAWDEKRQEMYYDFGICGKINLPEMEASDNFFKAVSCNSINKGIEHVQKYSGFEIMQYTGRKDKNKKEVYEGDVLGTWDRSQIIWYDELAMFGLTNHHAGCLPIDHYGEIDALEIIGNIYENPELLK